MYRRQTKKPVLGNGIDRAIRNGMTKVQRDYLRCIQALGKRGFPPTVREISDAMGVRSPHAADEMLIRLEKYGFIRRTPVISRSIVITPKGLDALGAGQ